MLAGFQKYYLIFHQHHVGGKEVWVCILVTLVQSQ